LRSTAVCPCVCLSARISSKPYVRTARNSLYMLPVAMAGSPLTTMQYAVYFRLSGRRYVFTSVCVCVSVCLRGYLRNRTRDLYQIFVHVVYVCGSVLLRHRDDRPHRLSAGRGDGSGQRGRSVIYDCLVRVCDCDSLFAGISASLICEARYSRLLCLYQETAAAQQMFIRCCIDV